MDARSFAGNPYDGHILNAQLEQSRTLLDDVGMMPREAVVDLGFRGGGLGQPGSGDHPPRQDQAAERAAKEVAQAQTGGGARDRAPQRRLTNRDLSCGHG